MKAIPTPACSVTRLAAPPDLPREGGSCSARLACKLGDLGRGAFDSEDLLVEAVNLLVPNRYSEFSQNFEQVKFVYCTAPTIPSVCLSI